MPFRRLWCVVLLALLSASAEARISRAAALNELGLPSSFNEKELKAAYRKRSLAAHPDKGGSTEEFIRVSEAYEVLSGGGGGSYGGGGSSSRRSGPSAGSGASEPTMDEAEMMRRAEEMFDRVFDEFLQSFKKGGTGTKET